MYAEMFEALDRFQDVFGDVLPQGACAMLFDRALSLEELEQVAEFADLGRELVHDA